MGRVRSLKNDRGDPVEGVQGFNEGRYQSGKIERRHRAARSASAPRFPLLPIVDDPKLTNERGLLAEMPESEVRLDAVRMQDQEGSTGEETPRHCAQVLFFAQLKPVRLEKPPGRDAIEVAADQREGTDGPWDPFDDVEEDLEWDVAEFGHGQLQVERGSEVNGL